MVKLQDAPAVFLPVNVEGISTHKWDDCMDLLEKEMLFFHKLLKIREPAFDERGAHQVKLEHLDALADKLTRLNAEIANYKENLSCFDASQDGIFNWSPQEEYSRLSSAFKVLLKEFHGFKKSSYSYIIQLFLKSEPVQFF